MAEEPGYDACYEGAPRPVSRAVTWCVVFSRASLECIASEASASVNAEAGGESQ